jgi:hypothetical protein
MVSARNSEFPGDGSVMEVLQPIRDTQSGVLSRNSPAPSKDQKNPRRKTGSNFEWHE